MFSHSSTLKEFGKKFPITSGIIIINLLVFVFTLLIGNKMYLNYGLIGGKEITDETYRIFTAAFIHGGFMHLAGNMLSIYLFGPFIEKRYKNIVYISLYTLFVFLSGLIVLFLSDGITVGASGAIFAILGFLYVLSDRLLSLEEKKMLRTLIIINAVLTLIIPGISIYGHFGGLVIGVIVGFIIKKL